MSSVTLSNRIHNPLPPPRFPLPPPLAFAPPPPPPPSPSRSSPSPPCPRVFLFTTLGSIGMMNNVWHRYTTHS